MPRHPTDGQLERLTGLVHQQENWVLRGDWNRYLDNDPAGRLRSISDLTRDQRVAALAWLRQQQHALHRALRGGDVAPDGWLESLPLHHALDVHRARAA